MPKGSGSGTVEWTRPVALPPVETGTEIIIDITGASPAVAIVEDVDAAQGHVFRFSGKGAPPFDADSEPGLTRSNGAASR